MAVKVSIVLTGIAIGLLVIYAADVAAGMMSEDRLGFLPFDHMARGVGLGMPSIILPIIAFFISRKEPSKALGGLIIIAGILIIIGGIVVLAMPSPVEAGTEERSVISQVGPLFGTGAFITALGAIKLKKS
ncbi:hypothetical protein C6988_06005 [Nitrosopumilus sp. b1]|uniref:hypothetical protein n=1 Tax=Nitrosopumilus sp. b1 TaxID=2109907 RepID=UPI0015F4232E|nr:hypothetical protein [Nitrosopumilus sp. b1]KAF6242978.1 hypothetical protein C6988_06005 [Nitrosopumilus sp. b1]